MTNAVSQSGMLTPRQEVRIRSHGNSWPRSWCHGQLVCPCCGFKLRQTPASFTGSKLPVAPNTSGVRVRSTQPRRHLADGWELHHAQTANFLMSTHFVKSLLGRRAVEAQDGNRLSSRELTADGHLGDVDVVLAE